MRLVTICALLISASAPQAAMAQDVSVAQRSSKVRLDAGRTIPLIIQQRLSTNANAKGDPIAMTVAQDVRVGDRLDRPGGGGESGRRDHAVRSQGRVRQGRPDRSARTLCRACRWPHRPDYRSACFKRTNSDHGDGADRDRRRHACLPRDRKVCGHRKREPGRCRARSSCRGRSRLTAGSADAVFAEILRWKVKYRSLVRLC